MLRLFTRIQWVVLVALLLSSTNHLLASTSNSGANISNFSIPTGTESAETDEAQDDDESYSGCGGFRTYTQGGWGATPSGSNPGAYLQTNFATAFPSGLIIGGTNKIVLTTATAVKNFLPQGSTPRQLNAGILTNPTKTAYSNVLAGQLAAAMISVKMDKTFANFAPSTTALGDLVVSHGKFKNWTVNQLLSAANSYIGGATSIYTAADFNLALTNINESYDNGVQEDNYLVCPITYTSSSINVSCFNGSNGSISVSGVTGGSRAPYTYSWSNGATTASINGLAAGTYTLTITDYKGLTSVKSFTISQPTQLNATSNAGSILCNGGTTTVNVGANGGTTPYTGTGNFTVNAGTFNYTVTDANGCTSSTSITVSQPSILTASSSAGSILCNGGTTTVNVGGNGGTTPYAGIGNFTVNAGTFNYTVTDANGCSATTSVTVSEPTLLTASSSAGSILCNGGTTTVNVGGNGGTTPYAGTGNFTVNAGTFNYTVTDANGCSATTSVTVSEPSLLTASSSAGSILCNGGSTTVNVGGNGGTTPYAGTGNYTVNAGTFNYTVTDANGCSASTSVTVSEPSLLTASSSAGSILCNGGSTTVNVGGNGGTTPYTGTGNFTVNAGTFNYTVTDANGCSASTSVTVSEPSLLSATSSAGSILCNGGTTTVNVGGNGGTTPYAGTGNFTVNAGTFNYTVTDANGCSASTSVTVSEPTALNVVSTSQTDDNSCNGGSCDGTATVNIAGGTAPYSYNWTGGTSSTNVLTAICFNTTPSVVVTDANGCTISASFNVINCELLSCDPLRTQTQGGWGATPKGNNPASILSANFTTVFPTGISVGANSNFIKLTSAKAVENFLPSGGKLNSISGVFVNPTSNVSNTLAGQLVAATINVAMDLNLANFSAPAHHLGVMYCNFHPFKGYTVNQVVKEANDALGGLVTMHTISDLVSALDKINQNYDNGNQDNGNLVCRVEGDDLDDQGDEHGDDTNDEDGISDAGRAANVNNINAGTINGLNLYPNPTENEVTVEFNANKVETTRIMVIGTNGQLIDAVPYTTVVGLNKHTMDVRNYAAHNNMLLIQIIVDGQVKQQMLSTPH